jgi:hypothetical protein
VNRALRIWLDGTTVFEDTRRCHAPSGA